MSALQSETVAIPECWGIVGTACNAKQMDSHSVGIGTKDKFPRNGVWTEMSHNICYAVFLQTNRHDKGVSN